MVYDVKAKTRVKSETNAINELKVKMVVERDLRSDSGH